MTFDDYKVTIRFETEKHGVQWATFEVMAYTPEEAECLAYGQYSDLNYDHIGVLTYETLVITGDLWDEEEYGY